MMPNMLLKIDERLRRDLSLNGLLSLHTLGSFFVAVKKRKEKKIKAPRRNENGGGESIAVGIGCMGEGRKGRKYRR